MNELSTLDLQGFVTAVTKDVFDTMVSMEISVTPSDDQPRWEGSRIVGSVGFAGDVMGAINLHVGEEFARLITAGMLGMEPEEVTDESEVHDVVGELGNMIAGDIKSRLCDAGLACELSIPSTTSGRDFKIESMGWNRLERFKLQSDSHVAWVDLSIKTGA
jgi:chemotaxis protein CheX